MAFNGDGPHSKRQRLEESGHRVSARANHYRASRRDATRRDASRPVRDATSDVPRPLVELSLARHRREIRAADRGKEARRHLSA